MFKIASGSQALCNIIWLGCCSLVTQLVSSLDCEVLPAHLIGWWKAEIPDWEDEGQNLPCLSNWAFERQNAPVFGQ